MSDPDELERLRARVAELERAEAVLAGRNRILRRMAEGAPLEEVLDLVARAVEEHTSGARVAIVLVDPDRGTARIAAAPSMPDAFVQAVDGMVLGPDTACCGAAVHERRRVVVPDVRAHASWAGMEELVERVGIRACWSEPMIRSDGDVLGAFAMYYGEPREPSELDVRIIETSAQLGGYVIQNARRSTDLRTSEQRLELVLAGADLGLWDWNVVTGERIINARWAEMLGHTIDEVEPHIRSWRERVHPDDQAEVEHALAEHLEGRAPSYDVLHRMRAKDGTWRWVHNRGRVVERDEHGAPLRMTGTHRDATAEIEAREERRRLDQRLSKSQRLDGMSTLAGGIAHDFNNLLVGILGNASLALSRLEPGDGARALVEDIERTSRRAAELAKQLLAYSGRSRFVLQPFDVSTLVRDTEQLLTSSLSKGVSLELELADDLQAVSGDPTQLRQVAMNLVANASDAYGGGSGVVRVRTGASGGGAGEWIPREPGDEPHVSLVVTDAGAGMDAETRAHVFDPFFTTKPEGHGFGLAAVLGIVRGHGGAIRVDSAPGQGATFEVALPACAAEAAELEEREAPAPAPASGGLVLIVDDERVVRELARRVLESGGYEVVTASNGEEGLRRYEERAGEVRCVLLDVSMPGMSGDETLRALRARWPDAQVVLSSGYDAKEATARVADEGRVGFLQKPYGVNELLAVVEEAVRSAAPRGA